MSKKKKRIAIVFEDKLHLQLGVFNAALNRARYLMRHDEFEVDVYMLQVYDGWFVRWLRRSERIDNRPEQVVVEGVPIHLIWFKRDIRDSFRHRVLHGEPRHFIDFLKLTARRLEGYDLVTAHDRMGGEIAEEAGRLFGIPWFVTWHGGNSVTVMLDDPVLRRIATRLLEGATCNFFVSRGLVDIMREFTPNFRADVLLNGANDTFVRLPDAERQALRARYGVDDGSPVVAFVGRFEPVKNPLMRELECTFMGQVARAEMPRVMNCMDLLVLPSSLEGLPLVTIEAMSCGAHVVASDVAGTAEAVGRDNAFALDDDFVERLTDRGVAMLRGEVSQSLPPEVSWEATARKEAAIYRAQFIKE